MRSVRHPITMFVVAVLAVIGIGVGVVAAIYSPVVQASTGHGKGYVLARIPRVKSSMESRAPVRAAAWPSGWKVTIHRDWSWCRTTGAEPGIRCPLR